MGQTLFIYDLIVMLSVKKYFIISFKKYTYVQILSCHDVHT